jgi:hypothetical protein
MGQTQEALSRRVAAPALLAFPFFAYLLITWVLPPPAPVRVEPNLLDPSWQMILTESFLHGAQFGRDIVYTYGPWGFIESPRGDPAIYPWLVSARLLIALAFISGIAAIACGQIRWLAGQFILVAGIVWFANPIRVLPVILLTARISRRKDNHRFSLLIHFLAIGCALTMWVKFTDFLIVGALAATLAAEDVLGRRLPRLSLEIVAVSLVFWMVARQSLGSLGLYLRSAYALASSYSSEMFLAGDGNAEVILVALLLLAALLPLVVLWRGGEGPHWPAAVWIALLLFFQLKEAFVRQDSFHIWMGIVNGLIPSVVILLCGAGVFRSGESLSFGTRALIRASAGFAIAVSVLLIVRETGTPAGSEKYRAMLWNADALKSLFGGRSLAAAHAQQLAEFRQTKGLERVTGTSDFFPDSQILLYGNQLDLSLPPVPQAFAAYNEYLSGLNAAFFRGVKRPDYVFFDISPIDNRYPSASDTLSWLALMECYEPAGGSGGYLILRAAGCHERRLDLITGRTVRAGDRVPIPSGGHDAIWAQIDIEPNTPGRILSLVARPVETTLEVLSAGHRQSFRFSPAMGRAGFLLSPLLRDPLSFGRLIQSGKSDPEGDVTEMAIIQPARARHFTEPAIRVRFYKIGPGSPIEARR